MKYFGHYSDQYSVYPYKLHKKLCNISSNVISYRVMEIVHDFIPTKSYTVQKILEDIKLYKKFKK